MKKAWTTINFLVLVCWLTACSVVRQVEDFPEDNYLVPARLFQGKKFDSSLKSERIKATLNLKNDTLYIFPLAPGLPTLNLSLQEQVNFTFYRRTFDLDVLTIPFKIRPSQKGFPEQLNPNFSAALYLGRRIDSYHVKPVQTNKRRTIISGFGGGYGGFLGIGAVTMNPFVTQNAIAYEYEGLVLTGGAAAIYDAKKFNLGLAIGSDLLVDDNRKDWLYHKKLWYGLLFGINLN